MNADESSWSEVEDKALFRNKPTELNFFVPAALSSGGYKIVLRTAYLSKDKSRKSVVETISNVVNVSA